MLSSTQISNSDANKHATTQLNPGNSPPATAEQITETIPDSDANKHDPTHDSTATSTTKINHQSSTKSQLIEADDTDPPKQYASTDSPTNKPKNNVDLATQDKSRKDLENLILQDLSYVDKISPKLGQHGERIKKEVEDARKKFEDLKKSRYELKDLKDLKKIVTKIMLQIPAKYRTYDETDQEKKKRTDLENKVVSWKTLKQMPKLHDELFHRSPFCKTIQKRYNDLRRELKLCLLCFTVFPENAEISRRLMVYWWIGEGLITLSEDEQSDGRTTAEDHANRLFKELMDDDFIEPVSKRHDHRNVAFCRMHPMVRAALVMIADEIKFFDFDEYGNPKDFGKFDELESPEDMPVIYPIGDPKEFFDFYDKYRKRIEPTETIDFLDSKGNRIPFAYLTDTLELPVDRDGKSIDTTQKYYFYRKKEISRRLYKVCLMGSGLSNGITWEKLHVLFNVKDDIVGFKPEWFLRMKNVNVLFLGRWQSSAAHHIEVEDFDFNESLDHMSHVRFFSLQGVSRISEIPKSISKLESLLILDLRACHNLEIIPKTIGSLKWLTHLDMSECYLLKDMPKEISSLVSLQVLKGFLVEESQGKQTCNLEDLKKLEYLRKLSMYTHMKHFPQDSHLDALRDFLMLRKLTILWSVHGSKNKNGQSKQDADQSTLQKDKKGEQDADQSTLQKDKKDEQDAGSKRKENYIHVWRRAARSLISQKKQRVKGSIRRMNAFNTLTLGSRLEKLDLKCFPNSVTPNWLTPSSLKGLKKLYIRGGEFSDIGQYQDILEWDIRPNKETWNVEVLRLKYLDELKMDWRELQDLFPKLTSLEKVKCPRLTLFPCNEHGIWTKNKTSTTT